MSRHGRGQPTLVTPARGKIEYGPLGPSASPRDANRTAPQAQSARPRQRLGDVRGAVSCPPLPHLPTSSDTHRQTLKVDADCAHDAFDGIGAPGCLVSALVRLEIDRADALLDFILLHLLMSRCLAGLQNKLWRKTILGTAQLLVPSPLPRPVFVVLQSRPRVVLLHHRPQLVLLLGRGPRSFAPPENKQRENAGLGRRSLTRQSHLHPPWQGRPLQSNLPEKEVACWPGRGQEAFAWPFGSRRSPAETCNCSPLHHKSRLRRQTACSLPPAECRCGTCRRTARRRWTKVRGHRF